MEDQFFRCTSTGKGRDLVFQFFFVHQIMFAVFHLHRVAEGTGSSGNDGDLVYRCRIRLFCCYQCMANFMIGYDQFLFLRKYTVLLLITGDNHFDTLFHIRLCGKSSAISDRTECCLIDNIGKFGTGSTGCSFRNSTEIYVICNLDLLCMNLQDLFPSLQIRQFHRDSPVKTSRTKQCRIQGIRTVGCCQNDNTFGSVKSVHLSQQLVQSLFSLIITADIAVTLFTNGIDLVDKNDTRCFFVRLFEQVTHFCSTHTYEHLHKL